MKIKLQDEIIETDNLTDKNADILQAIDKLHNVCQKYGVTSFARVILDEKKYCGMTTTTKDEKKVQSEFDFLMHSLATFINNVSGGKMMVMVANEE